LRDAHRIPDDDVEPHHAPAPRAPGEPTGEPSRPAPASARTEPRGNVSGRAARAPCRRSPWSREPLAAFGANRPCKANGERTARARGGRLGVRRRVVSRSLFRARADTLAGRRPKGSPRHCSCARGRALTSEGAATRRVRSRRLVIRRSREPLASDANGHARGLTPEGQPPTPQSAPCWGDVTEAAQPTCAKTSVRLR